MITATLPLPPSVNNLFFNLPKGGRAPTGRYKQWQKEAGLKLKMQVRAQSIKGPVIISYRVEDSGRCDLGNLEKPLTDLLVKHGVIEGDERKFVRGIWMIWDSAVQGVVVTVDPEPAGERPCT